MIPFPPSNGGIALYDTECFPNYWLLKLRPIKGQAYTFAIRDGQRFDDHTLSLIRQAFNVYTVVSFNGNHYDVPMIRGVLHGMNTAQLKALNDRIIVEQVKPWNLGLGEWTPRDHIDLIEVAPGQGSQKQYAGRIHCKTMRDLPYEPDRTLRMEEMSEVDDYCENDLDVLRELFFALKSQLRQRERLGQRYGLDLRSKSDAQVAEAVLKKRCEIAIGERIYKPEIDWSMRFKCNVPDFIQFTLPQLQRALALVKDAVFHITPPQALVRSDVEKGKCVSMPPQLEGLEIVIGSSTYKMGIGGLHSQEKKLVAVSNDTHQIVMPDVASYYPNLMVNAGAWPPALGRDFVREFEAIKRERLADKEKVKALKAQGLTGTVEYEDAVTGDGGGKIMINGTFGKTGSPWSVLFAPQMMIQTTVPGQLALLMLIEWHEHYDIPVISANTDGLVINCPRDKLYISEHLIKEWEKRTGLTMETEHYRALYARDVNNYFAVHVDKDGKIDVKRKGEYARAGLIEKKNPDVEICADAVAEFLAHGTPIVWTITKCQDIRKFVTIQRVNGGGVKMWGEGPKRDDKVADMTPTLLAHGWERKSGKWCKGAVTAKAADAYASCFEPRKPEYMGKVCRWYYSTKAPGPIVYASNGNTVGMSYGARPCMTLPDKLPDDIDYDWYVKKAEGMLKDVGYYTLSS